MTEERGPGFSHDQILAHIRKISTNNCEERLLELLTSRLGEESARAYRQAYLDSYGLSPKETDQLNTLTINVSELCNFKCSMCDVPGNNRKTVNLSSADIVGFLREAADRGARCCMLGSGSEITLHPDWREILTAAISLFPDTILFTNGSLLASADLEFFIDSGLTRLFISLDAANKETFQRIRGYDMLETIEDTICRLLQLKRELDSISPLVRVSFVLQDANANELDQFIDKWIDRVDSVEIQKLYDISSFRDRDYVDMLSAVEVSNTTNARPMCHYPFSYLSLWAHGGLSPCCTSYGRDSHELTFANINDKDAISKALRKRTELQKAFLSEDWNQIPNTCKHCLQQ